jgi:hypothetical protein
MAMKVRFVNAVNSIRGLHATCTRKYLKPRPSGHLHTAVSKERATKEDTVKSTFIAPSSIKEFLEQRRRKWKPTNEVYKRTKKPTNKIMGVKKPPF